MPQRIATAFDGDMAAIADLKRRVDQLVAALEGGS